MEKESKGETMVTTYEAENYDVVVVGAGHAEVKRRQRVT